MVSTSKGNSLLDAEDDALGDLGHLSLAVLDRQFGAGGQAANIVVAMQESRVQSVEGTSYSVASVVFEKSGTYRRRMRLQYGKA